MASRNPRFQVGETVLANAGWQDYALSDGADLTPLRDMAQPSLALGGLGMPGFTAYVGLLDRARLVGRLDDRVIRQELAAVYTGELITRWTARRGVHPSIGKLWRTIQGRQQERLVLVVADPARRDAHSIAKDVGFPRVSQVDLVDLILFIECIREVVMHQDEYHIGCMHGLPGNEVSQHIICFRFVVAVIA